MNRKFSIPVSDIDVTSIGNHFLKLNIYAISDGDNRNGSEFLLESFEPSIPSFYDKPILAYFNKDINDVEEHNSRISVGDLGEVFEDFQYEGGEKPVGFIPRSSTITIENINGKNWIVIKDALIWSNYSKQLADLIKRHGKKKVSVEVTFLDSYMDGEIERVKLFDFLGLTILGERYDEGIEGAHLTLQDIAETEKFKNYRKACCFALEKQDKSNILSKYGIDGGIKMQNDKFISKDDYGTGKTISVDKSKDSVSTSSWGAVDKTSLRNETLKAKNYKSLVHDVYLDVKSGWEESPSENLKYPVMQIKGGKAVYNEGGLLSAQQYGEKYDSGIAKKALSIRKKLGLAESDKEAKMKKFIDSAKEQGMSFIGLFNNKLRFVEACSFKDDEDVEKEEMAKKEMAVFEVDADKCGDHFVKDECKELKMKAFDEDEEEEEDEDDDDVDIKGDPDKKKDKDTEASKFAKEAKEAKEKCRAVEKEKEKMATKLKETEAELKKMKKCEFEKKMDEVFADSDCDCDEEEKEELKKMAADGKFESFEDFKKEYAYRKLLKKEKEKKETCKFKFSVAYSGKSSDGGDPLDLI